MSNQTLLSFGIQSGSGGSGGGSVPAGGEEGQYLQKASATDYDTQWNWVQRTYLLIENNEGSTLSAGTPVYPRGVSGNRILVGKAIASNASKMPAIGVVTEEILNGGTGYAISQGLFNKTISGLSGVVVGQKIFVSDTGTLTNVKPATQTNLIQNIGVVLQTSGSNIQKMKVSAIDRTNDVPNLSNGYFFIGSGTYTQESAYFLPTTAPSDEQFLQYDAGNGGFFAKTLAERVTFNMGGLATGWNARQKLFCNHVQTDNLLASTIASPAITTPANLLRYPISNLDANLQTSVRVSGYVICQATIQPSSTFRVELGLATPTNGSTSATFTMTFGSSSFPVSTSAGAMNFFNETISFTSASNQLLIVGLGNRSATTQITSGQVRINMRIDIQQEFVS